MKFKLNLMFLIILFVLIAGCKQKVQPEQIAIEQEKEPVAESPQEINEKQTEEPVQNEEEPKEEKESVSPPKIEEKPLPKATISEEEFSKIYEGNVDLRNFPTMFVAWNKDNEKVFNGLLIVGKNAPVTDVIAAQNVAAGVNNGIRRPGYSISAVLDEQVEDVKAQNAIVIGNPCDNKAAAALLGHNKCDANLQPGKAIISLYENNGHIQMVVVGYDAKGTLKASEYLREYYKYDLSGKKFEFSY